jgi:hypothetical protein
MFARSGRFPPVDGSMPRTAICSIYGPHHRVREGRKTSEISALAASASAGEALQPEALLDRIEQDLHFRYHFRVPFHI